MGSPMKGRQRIAIGIYVDSDGVADFRPDEILATLGYPPSAAHVLTALRYVEMNPVRVGPAATAWECEWSSARAHVWPGRRAEV